MDRLQGARVYHLAGRCPHRLITRSGAATTATQLVKVARGLAVPLLVVLIGLSGASSGRPISRCVTMLSANLRGRVMPREPVVTLVFRHVDARTARRQDHERS